MAKGIAHRRWTIDRQDYETEEDFLQALEVEAVRNVHLMDRLGVAVVSAPKRLVTDRGEGFTVGMVYETATVPGAREAQADVEADELSDEELAGAVGLTDD